MYILAKPYIWCLPLSSFRKFFPSGPCRLAKNSSPADAARPVSQTPGRNVFGALAPALLHGKGIGFPVCCERHQRLMLLCVVLAKNPRMAPICLPPTVRPEGIPVEVPEVPSPPAPGVLLVPGRSTRAGT